MPLLTVARSPIALLRFADLAHPERGVRNGELVKIRPGVYASARDWNALAAWDRYLARVHAVAMVCPDVVFSCESAAALQGMSIFGDPVVVHVLASPLATARLVAGIRVHTTGGHREVVEIGGMLMTSPAETAVDLARSRHAAIGLAAADAALRIDPSLSAESLVAINEGRASKRGRALARWPLGAATALAETALESVSRATIAWLGFPEPTLQVTFRSAGGQEDRSDFVWRGISLAGESDGDLKFDGRYGDPRELLRRQRERDARLRSRHVEAVAHWGWVEATTVDPLRTLLLGHGLKQVAPEQPAQLYSLRRAVSPNPPHRAAPLPNRSR
ncbi:hypothetical protein HF576_00075 [Microbacterium sp. CFH 90308]|uniref:Transcriptional regulator, AbiEi antitoxin, Type IV TA system n=1 Tax=Microbacterium salsuginis TaxID=2722803 RepID=A0ABX1KA03_9MICO|nr:hypothetical protein [Microbacterium sp. CFH 90308]NLP82236.1 hypothetical protein [Microbacterium sp. CFH 90308]